MSPVQDIMTRVSKEQLKCTRRACVTCCCMKANNCFLCLQSSCFRIPVRSKSNKPFRLHPHGEVFKCRRTTFALFTPLEWSTSVFGGSLKWHFSRCVTQFEFLNSSIVFQWEEMQTFNTLSEFLESWHVTSFTGVETHWISSIYVKNQQEAVLILL